MGKYSIENYEQYKMVKCRPEEDRAPGYSRFTTLEIAPDERPELKEKTLLRVRIPAGGDAAAEAGIRALAARYSRDPAVIGVAPAAGASPRGAEILAEAFRPKRLFVPVADGDMLRSARERGFLGGLLAEAGENPLDTCEAFAENGAQRLFEQVPVLVRFTGPEKADGRYALQWHAAAVEGVQVPAGPRIALRRLTYPKALTSGGFAPMRFWWTNRGPSPLYGRTGVRLRVVREGETFAEILPGDCPEIIPLGDRVFNQILRLPELPEGEYRLEFGLFREDGTPVPLANANPAGGGYYDGDVIRFDRVPRPEYETAWETYRPDGYYPLEDPKTPGA